MAITDIQISEELETNAPSIKYRGNEGPKSPQEMQQMMAGLGGGGGIGNMMSARGSANLLSRLTAFTATLFMIMSVVLTITASVGSDKNVLESLPSINLSTESDSEPVIPENN